MTILENLKELGRLLLKKDRAPEKDIAAIFRFKYSLFKELLASNTELLTVITDIEEKLEGHQVFGMSYIRSQSSRAVFHAFRMAKSLNVLSGGRYPNLYSALEKINRTIREQVEQRKDISAPALVLSLDGITKEQADWVGGKSSNLGEVRNRVGLPVPEGFAITTGGYRAFLEHNELVDEINKRKMLIDVTDPESIETVSREIQELILAAPVPPELQEAIMTSYHRLDEVLSDTAAPHVFPRVSLRSSAIGEDSELSYAGQYLSLLNLPPERLLDSYRRIIASLYDAKAISYRLNKGIRDEDIAMSVACLEMVDALAAGVVYSRHPFNVMDDTVQISAVWGLGPYAVDGTITPDTYRVAKDQDRTIQEMQVAVKPVQLTCSREGGLQEEPVPPEQQAQPCLSPEQIKLLAGYAVELEEHYQGPQDIEWALNRQGRLLILQSRPLNLECPAEQTDRCIPQVPGYAVLLEAGTVAYPGVGCGPAFVVQADEDLLRFPDGAVLVARHSSPRYVLVMPRAAAIITDFGNVSGHMAALVREFRVPTILNTQTATTAVTSGQELTVDAYTSRVYAGRVPELFALTHARQPHMQDTPVYRALRQVADAIVPLNLVDPKAPDFTPEHCRTLHDISRYVHEMSYAEMFQISDIVSAHRGGAVKLQARIPLDLYLIDLGDGLAPEARDQARVMPEQVVSVPFIALLKGMLREELSTLEPKPVNLGGLFTVMREQMLCAPGAGERFGDRSYAIISAQYLNFSSRVGYHYSILDAYCGDTPSKNYITFSFKGGAADDVRRNRRVRAIARILTALDFSVDVKGDKVDARVQKYTRDVLESKLDQLGRLLQFTRQMDMLMVCEASVEEVARQFLLGNYKLDPAVFTQAPTEPDQADPPASS